MAADGDYPFFVKVRNDFYTEKGTNRPNIAVCYYYYPHIDGANKTDPPTISNTHHIVPGECLSFPLHWKNEYLEITLDTDNYDGGTYYIWCGAKALCRLQVNRPDNKDVPPTVLSCEGKKDIEVGKDGYKYYKGGGWKSTDIQQPWTLIIKKQFHDPEEENVTVGEDPPT